MMRKIQLTAWFAALAFGGLMTACNSERPVESPQALFDQFADPSSEFRTKPFMVWNTEITPERIDRILNEYKEQGCGGVFIHPRLGLITEYLSPTWNEMVKYTVDKGRELGLEVWLYDENSYPSGFGGGHVPREMPEAYNQGQGLNPTVVDRMPDDVSPYFVIVAEKDGKLENVTDRAVSMKGESGKFYLYAKTQYQPSPWYAGGPYVDLLAHGVTDKFMEITMQGYEQTFGGDLKGNVKGIFTDEPEIVSPGGVRWTPDLFEVFLEKYGYDLSACLPQLHEQIGDWQKVRHDYFQLLNRLFVERWAQPWYNYCAEKGISWTGHYWEHNWPVVTGVTDNMSMAAWQQVPGIDMLFNQFNESSTGAQFGNIRSVKEVNSIANQLNRPRILSETYGGGGWNVTFKDMKRLCDWQMVLGVNLVNQHVGHMSMAGVRKFDYPPMFNQSAAWWDNYRVLNDYIARICTAMSFGEQYNDVLVLEPTTSVWMYNQYCGSGTQNRAMEIGQAFQNLVTELEHAQVEFDLGCEDIFRRYGSVRNGKFVVGERAYGTFVIAPQTENLERETFDLLREFVQKGGHLIALGKPTRVEGELSPEVEAFFASEQVIAPESLTQEVIDSYLQSEKIRFVRKEGGDLHHNRREFKDGQTLLLVNASLDEASEVEVVLDGKHVVRMDALDGKIYEMPAEVSDGKVTVKRRIEPAESVLLYVSEKPVAAEKERVLTGGTPLTAKDSVQIERVRDNVLLIDFIDLQSGDDLKKDIYYNNAGTEVFRKAGLSGNPWFWAMQYKQDIVNMDLSAAPGFTAFYRFTVSGSDVDKESMKILVERPWLYTVKVNGTPVQVGIDAEWALDEEFKLIPIGEYVRTGENTIELIADKLTVHTELGAVYVLGNFDVRQQGDRWTVVPASHYGGLQDWQSLGAPFYPWEMKYVKRFDVESASGKSFYVEADKWTGSHAEVWVNGQKAGVLMAEPYTLDVTSLVHAGENEVELRVVGNMENMIGPHHMAYNGIVDPNRWNVPTWRKASEYFLTPFGLKKDFELKEL